MEKNILVKGTLYFNTLNDLNGSKVWLFTHAHANVIQIDEDRKTIKFELRHLALYSTLEKFKFSYYESFTRSKNPPVLTYMEKDDNGNITHEVFSDGFKDEKHYNENGKMILCRSTYPNGLVESERFAPN